MERLREILAFVNDKGGVAKTTSVQNLAAGIVRFGKGHIGKDENGKTRTPRVLIIDLDPQVAGISLLSGWIESEHTGKPTMFESLSMIQPLPVYKIKDNIYLAPSSSKLIGIDPFLHQQLNPLKQLHKCLCMPIKLNEEDGGEQNVMDAFDYVLIDCPPAMNNLTKNAMAVASGIIVPIQLEALATFGSSYVIRLAQSIREEGINPDLDLRGILKVMVDNRPKVSKGFSAHINEEYGKYVFKAEIPRAAHLGEAQAMFKDIFEYAPYKSVGIAYEKFAKEIISTYKSNQ